MKKKNKKKEDEIYNDCWLYVLLLTTLVILLESIKKYTFSIGQANLTYGIFLLPIQYFIVSYIAKKYDYKKAISAIAISGVFLVCFRATISFFLKESLILTNVSGEFFGYVVSQFVFLQIYLFLLNNTKFPPLIVYLDYLFSIKYYRTVDVSNCISLSGVTFVIDTKEILHKKKIEICISKRIGVKARFNDKWYKIIPLEDKNSLKSSDSVKAIIDEFIYQNCLKNERLSA